MTLSVRFYLQVHGRDWAVTCETVGTANCATHRKMAGELEKLPRMLTNYMECQQTESSAQKSIMSCLLSSCKRHPVSLVPRHTTLAWCHLVQEDLVHTRNGTIQAKIIGETQGNGGVEH